MGISGLRVAQERLPLTVHLELKILTDWVFHRLVLDEAREGNTSVRDLWRELQDTLCIEETIGPGLDRRRVNFQSLTASQPLHRDIARVKVRSCAHQVAWFAHLYVCEAEC